MNTNGYELPVYLVKGVNTSDFIADLGPLQFGLYDNDTNYPATASGSGTEFYLALGSMHTRDKLSKWYSGMLDPKKGEVFKGLDIKGFHRSNPSKPANEQWALGYDGAKSTATLSYTPDTTYTLQIRLYGEPVYKYWGNDVFKEISLYTGCDPNTNTDCTQSCGDTYLGVKTQTKAWVKQINTNPDLQEFGIKAYPIFSDYNTVATTGAFTGGTGTAATTSVQTNNGVITGITVLTPGSYTTAPTGYTVTNAGGGTGATFTIQTAGSNPYTVTGVTVTAGGKGYTTDSAITLYKYTLKVVDNGDAGALQSVQRQYPSSNLITKVTYNRGVSTYTTDYIAALPAAYAPKTFNYAPDCGACQGSDALVPQYDIYQVRRQLASSTDLSTPTTQTNYAAQIVTDYSGVTGSGRYEGIIAGEAVVSFNKTFGATVTALNSDVVKRTTSTQAYCQTTVPATVAWVQGVGGYVTTRSLTITIPNEDCNNAVTLAQVQASLASTKGVVSNNVTDITATGSGINGDNCVKVFQVVQNSSVMNDQWCMTQDNSFFYDLPSYQGVAWQEVIPAETYDPNLKAGIRIVAPFYSQKFGVDSYSPTEYYDIDPLQMEVSLLSDPIVPCTFNSLVKAHRVLAPKYSRLSGYFVMANYIKKNSAYKTYEEWANDPRGREVIDNTVLSQMNRDAYYIEYHIKYMSKKNGVNFAQKGEDFDSIVYIDETDTATQQAFETAVLGVTAKWGVYLKNRGK